MRRRLTVVLAVVATAVSAVPAAAQTEREVVRDLPASIQDLALEAPLTFERAVLDRDLRRASGPVQVAIRLTDPSVAEGGDAAGIADQQAAFIDELASIDDSATVIGSVSHVLNSVFVEMQGEHVATVSELASVGRITKVADYEHDLSETVPYIGATAVHETGVDGTGITVAVLDSGVDYTHANLGGGGTIADYDAAYVDPASRDGLFPTAKVVDGHDFVGEVWPTGPLSFDDDPIDFDGHGTHVSDIIAGTDGVAPGAALIGVKVCSSVSPACSGIALILGMEFAVVAGVDIINMSLGSIYGQAFDDDLSAAVEGATALGVLTVASAGNSADKPYSTGTPAATPSALSVAQTQVPSAALQLIEVDGVEHPAVFQPWSTPLPGPLAGPVQYGDGAGGNLNGCAPFAAGSLTGLVVLVDRGACNFTLKIKNVGDAGGIVGIIGLVAPGAPFSGGDGGDAPITIPGYMISQSASNAIKATLGSTATVDPANQLPLIGQLVGSSARGPSMLSNLVKPEIGAPGASVSAIVGTGDGTGPFGGTSGAAPMVSGSAALVLQASPGLSPAETKARLINTGETNIDTDPFTGLAPISRIGGGEVRADRAVAAGAAAWETDTLQGALSFGLLDATDSNAVLKKTVTVRNYTNARISYDIEPSFRFADDAASGAIDVTTPSKVVVQANSTAEFVVQIKARGGNLPSWPMNSGSLGANPDALTAAEFDGYVSLTDSKNADNDIHLPWHVLPRRSGDVDVNATKDVFRVKNDGVGETTVEAYSLIATSADLPEGPFGGQAPTPDLRYVGYTTIPVPAGFCSGSDSFLLGFAVNSWERQTHANAPALFEFDIDTDQDGTFDYAVFNVDLSFLTGTFDLSDGRNLVVAQDLSTGDASAFFFTDHQTNSGNTVLYICGEQIGMNANDFLDPMDVVAFAGDLYFGGPGDATDLMTISPLGEQFLGVFEDGGVGLSTIAGRDSDTLQILDFGPATNTTETGLLLLHRGGAAADNEATIIEP